MALPNVVGHHTIPEDLNPIKSRERLDLSSVSLTEGMGHYTSVLCAPGSHTHQSGITLLVLQQLGL